MLRLKICGMRLAANIAVVAELQPDYMGFIFYEKSPRLISEVSEELIRYIPAQIKTVGVFVNEDLETVKEKINTLNLKAVQLHGSESSEYCGALKLSFPMVEIIKAFGIDEDFDFSALEAYLGTIDYFLFDTKTKLHGGSGKTFNWSVLDRYTYTKPYFLSGGIDLEHAAAVKKLNDDRLYALDINSRFETEPGVKDAEKIKEFIKEMNK